MEKIKELMDISDNRIGNMIMDLSNEMDGFERRCEVRAEKLQAQIEELKQQISLSKRLKKIHLTSKCIQIREVHLPFLFLLVVIFAIFMFICFLSII